MKNIKKVLAAVLMIAVMFSITGCNSSDYKKAAQMMADGDYAAASEMFKALGDYEDSADQAKECDYQIAKAAFDAGDYENAIELLRGEYSSRSTRATAPTSSRRPPTRSSLRSSLATGSPMTSTSPTYS